MKQGVARKGLSRSGSMSKRKGRLLSWFWQATDPQLQALEQPEPHFRQMQRREHSFAQVQWRSMGGALGACDRSRQYRFPCLRRGLRREGLPTSVDSFGSRTGYGPFCMAFYRASSAASATYNVNSSISASVSGRVPIVASKVATRSIRRRSRPYITFCTSSMRLELHFSSRLWSHEDGGEPIRKPVGSNGARGVAVASHI